MSTHRVAAPNVEDLIRLADAGDKRALRDLYVHASAWARGGTKPIPEPLGTWIAGRLLDVARTIDARLETDAGRCVGGMARGGSRDMAAQLAVALKVQRAGKKGRTPAERTTRRAVSLARDVLHFMEWENLLPHQACVRAVEYDQSKMAGRIGASVKTYEEAWAAHGADLMREAGLEYANPDKRR